MAETLPRILKIAENHNGLMRPISDVATKVNPTKTCNIAEPRGINVWVLINNERIGNPALFEEIPLTERIPSTLELFSFGSSIMMLPLLRVREHTIHYTNHTTLTKKITLRGKF